jgi:hypothetical protein
MNTNKSCLAALGGINQIKNGYITDVETIQHLEHEKDEEKNNKSIDENFIFPSEGKSREKQDKTLKNIKAI